MNKQKLNSTDRTTSKSHLNSLYGKTRSNPDVAGKYPVAHTRELIITHLQNNYDRFIYCDTDSLYHKNKGDGRVNKDLIERLHEKREKAIKLWKESEQENMMMVAQYQEGRAKGLENAIEIFAEFLDGWSNLGVNDDNADFVKVEELEE